MSCSDTPDNISAPGFLPMARPIEFAVTEPPMQSHPTLLSEHGRAGAWWDVLVLAVVVVILEMVMGEVLKLVISQNGSGDDRLTNVLFTLARGGIVLVVVGIIVRNRVQGPASVGLCSEQWWVSGLFGVAGAAGAYVAFYAVLGVMLLAFPAAFQSIQKNPERIVQEIPKLHPLALCGIAVFVGIYEEIVFRGFVLIRLRRATGSILLAVFLSTALFAAPHALTQQPETIPLLFAIGVVWAALTLWRKSVIPAIIAHGIFDLVQFMVLYLFYPQWE